MNDLGELVKKEDGRGEKKWKRGGREGSGEGEVQDEGVSDSSSEKTSTNVLHAV